MNSATLYNLETQKTSLKKRIPYNENANQVLQGTEEPNQKFSS